ncbi:hypothetical protein [Haliangium sp.]|uniref:hypothetical protein n=1 Tax=Haliangium sp. TaxID=2663208 RepID=UPI003D0E0E0B
MNRHNKDENANAKALHRDGRSKRATLTLNRTTLRELQSNELGAAVGGGKIRVSIDICPI